MNARVLLKPYLRENRHRILLGVLCLIAVDMLQLCIPRIIKWAVDDLTLFQADRRTLFTYALYIVGLAVAIGGLRYVWRRCLIGTSRRVEEGLRNRLFHHMQTLSAPYFDRVTTGDLMAHATNDIQNVRMATGMGIVALTDAVVLGTAAVGFMAYINVRLTLFVMIPMPFIVFGTKIFSRKLHSRYLGVQGAFSDLTEVVRERFSGIRLIKAHNREAASVDHVDDASRRYVQANLQLVAITRSLFPMMVFFSNLSLAIILFMGGRETIGGTITPGDFVAFISYLGLLTWPMMAMGWVTNLIQRGKASLDRIGRILQVAPDIQNRPRPADPRGWAPATAKANALFSAQGAGGAALTFDRVTFAYPAALTNARNGPRPVPVLSDIHLDVAAGTVLGIVGPPGSGKTTLLSLIARIYDVTGGAVRIQGTDVRHWDLEALRSTVAFVPQEPFLFAGTLRENIAFGNPEVGNADLGRAVAHACLEDTVNGFSRGLDTVVGEKGVILSGGQKQRVALARALLKPAPLIVLDDPISQVDAETGSRIVSTLYGLAGDQTVLIVSHRLSAVRSAHRIVCLDKGRVVESGDHDALMGNSGYYANTYRLQAVEEQYNAP